MRDSFVDFRGYGSMIMVSHIMSASALGGGLLGVWRL